MLFNNSCLEDVCVKITDGTHDTPMTTDEGVPYLTAIHVKDGRIDFDSCYFLPENEHKKIYSRCNPEKGDVLFVNIGAGTGACAFVNVDFEFSLKNVALIKPDNRKLLGKYLEYYQILNKPNLFHALTSGGAQPFLSLKEIRRLKVSLPDIKAQSKIIDILQRWDHAIDLTDRLIAAKHERRTWLMQQLLTGKRRLPGFGKKWKNVRLSELFQPVRRKNNKGVTHVLTASGEHGLVDQSEYFNRNVAGESLEGYYLLRRGEFAYNRSSMNGYPYGAIKRLDEYDEGVLSTLYICFEPNSTDCYSDFFKHLFEGGVLNEQLRKVVQVGARAHGLLNVTLHDFFSLKVPCPPVEEQRKIASTIDIVERELDLLRAQLDALREQKKGLMQQLLTGKVRVKVNL